MSLREAVEKLAMQYELFAEFSKDQAATVVKRIPNLDENSIAFLQLRWEEAAFQEELVVKRLRKILDNDCTSQSVQRPIDEKYNKENLKKERLAEGLPIE